MNYLFKKFVNKKRKNNFEIKKERKKKTHEPSSHTCIFPISLISSLLCHVGPLCHIGLQSLSVWLFA